MFLATAVALLEMISVNKWKLFWRRQHRLPKSQKI